MSKFLRMASLLLTLVMLMPCVVSSASAEGDDVLEITGLVISYGTNPDQLPDHWKIICDKFNINYTIDWAPDGDAYGDKLALRLSSGNVADLTQVRDLSEASVAQALEAGLFADVTDLLGDFSEYPNLGALPKTAWDLSRYKGRNYLIPRTRGQYNMPLTLIRADYLTELNMEMPKTTEELANYFKGVKALHPEVIPCPYPILWERLQPAFGPGPVEPVWTEDGEGLVHPYLCDSYVDYLLFWNDLYAAGCLAKEYSLISTGTAEEMFMTGQSASCERNIYHYKRLENGLQTRTDPNGTCLPLLYVEGPDGRYAFDYDKGYWGGMMISSSCPIEKQKRILKFLDQTADPANFNLLVWGDEGVHWNMVNGEPQMTEKGALEISSSSYGPFIIACDTYQKVNSPYATPEENVAMREMVKIIDECGKKYANSPLCWPKCIVSEKWGAAWSGVQDEFKELEVGVITGQVSADEFREYQQELLADKEIQEALKELAQVYLEAGFPRENPPVK